MTEIRLEGMVESVEPQYDVDGKSSVISVIRSNDQDYTVHCIRKSSLDNNQFLRHLSLSLDHASKNGYIVRVTVKPLTDKEYFAVSWVAITKEKYTLEKN